jgi:hypothetical protein
LINFLGIQGSVRQMKERGMLNKVKEDEEEEEHHRKQTPESKKNYESICKVLDAHTIKRLNAQVPEIQWQY